ncbi:hypothetical protein CH380_17590 [Leptospira adleri]|uniref:Uncharacterized protein n=1 Tax=Leptospira adleri TaxID=2023186 RepID=A0A2M9YK10_9LEPT|nr:hypothetical protein CH380_17590 [Leptospira adleri]PJZ59714.1 hypothetical protein CH376_22330 [Leptospira adleri]
MQHSDANLGSQSKGTLPTGRFKSELRRKTLFNGDSEKDHRHPLKCRNSSKNFFLGNDSDWSYLTETPFPVFWSI